MPPILLFLLLFPFCINAQHYTVIEQVNVVDVVNGRIIPSQTVLIKDNIIENIGNKISVPANAKKIKGKGKYLIPGLIDTHLHIGSYAQSQNHILKQIFKFLLANGITGIREAGFRGGLKQMIAIRDSIDEGKVIAPKLYLSGFITNSSLKRFNAATLTALVDTFNALGVNGIKIKRVTFKQSKEIIDAAKRHYLPVYGHTYNAWENETNNVLGDFTNEAIDYGISGVMHSIGSIPTGKNILPPTPEPVFTDTSKLWAAWWLYSYNLWLYADEEAEKEYIQKLVTYKVWLEPTLSSEEVPCTYPQLLKSKALKYLLMDDDPNTIYGGGWFPAPKGTAHDSVCLSVKRMQLFAKRFYDAGGLLLAGTDGMLYGYDLRDELQNLIDAGIPTAAVLKIATYNNALALGWIKNYGTVEKGKIANLVLLKKNPLVNIKNVELIEAVVVNGKSFNKKILNQWKRETAQLSKHLRSNKPNEK